MSWKKVTKEQYNQFIKEYPNSLDWNISGIFDPPIGSHNDFSNGKIWPESMVGKVLLNEMYKETEWERPNEYFIKEIADGEV